MEKGRLYVLVIIAGSVVASFAFMLFLMQIVNGASYVEQANDQYIRPASDTLRRGNIFFMRRDGELIAAATIKRGYTVAIEPRALQDPEAAFRALGSFFDIDREDFFRRAAKRGDPYEEIARRVPKETAERIRALGIPGIIVARDGWRYYPGGKLAAQTLGFVGYKGDVRAGRYGVERYYEDVLSRSENTVRVNFFAELFSNITQTLLRGENRNEGDVVLTVEPSVQTFLEKTLRGVVERYDAAGAGAIVMDPADGRIYALAALPSFNPNEYAKEDPDTFSNPIVEDVYEFGSVFKPLTMAAGLDAGVVTAETTYRDEGYVLIDGARISNYDGKARGVVSMQEVLNQSLNTGAVFVERRLGGKRFADYMRAYGIDEETGVDLPAEASPIAGNLDSPRDIELATVSFGQGVAVSPVAMIRSLAVLANGGKLVTPYVTDRIIYRLGGEKKHFPDEGVRVLKKETSEEITRMLVRVVDEALAGGDVSLPRYSIAAKTGTAQMAGANGGYDPDKFLHSFFGYFPAYKPRFIVFFYVVEPRGARYASQTLTDPFMKTAKFLINYYELPPDR